MYPKTIRPMGQIRKGRRRAGRRCSGLWMLALRLRRLWERRSVSGPAMGQVIMMPMKLLTVKRPRSAEVKR